MTDLNMELCFRHRLKVSYKGCINFKRGELNTIIGNNGSGKSVLLRSIHECNDCVNTIGDTHYFNSETMNPHKDEFHATDLRGLILKSRGVFSSHGEILRSSILSLHIPKGSTLLVDEPEMGQDLYGIQLLINGFDILLKNGCTIILATHHPLFIRGSYILELVDGYSDYISDTLGINSFKDSKV